MKVTISTHDNFIAACIPLQSTLDDLNKWKQFMREVFRFSVEGKKFYLFTLSPQKYSMGYELKPFEELNTGNESVLVNYIDIGTDELITQIVDSEEFERGLLKIVITDNQRSFENLSFVSGNYNNITDELIACEDDGTSIYWHNPHVPVNQIHEKLQQLLVTS